MLDVSQWHDYPMGPKLRRYFGIPDHLYHGNYHHEISAKRQDDFLEFSTNFFEENKISDREQLIDLAEELLAMAESKACLNLVSLYGEGGFTTSFRGLLVYGTSLLLEDQMQKAEELLIAAQHLEPYETAPYVNLSQLYLCKDQLDLAYQWVSAGLDVDHNHPKLWELMLDVLRVPQKDNISQLIKEQADSRHSWVGTSLAGDLTAQDDYLLKSQWLESFYNDGLRSTDFLIEYTAVLGLSKQFEKVPLVLWQLEALSKDKPPWQLYVHTAQAYLAMEKWGQFQEVVRKVFRDPNLPESVRKDLETESSLLGEPL